MKDRIIAMAGSELSHGRLRDIVVFSLLITVLSQIAYISMREAGIDFDGKVIWGIEVLAFMAISIIGGVLMSKASRLSLAWAAIALGGFVNVVQVGFGIAMFGPLEAGGENAKASFEAVLNGAFFYYFTGKFLFGFAASAFGLTLLGHEKGGMKVLGLLAGITGLLAMATNYYAMITGLDFVMVAGAAGTIATFLLAVTMGFVSLDKKRA